LALNVYFAECGGTEAFELCCGFSDSDAILTVAFIFNDVLRTVRFEEFTAYLIVVETKFVSEETECDIYVSAACQRTTCIG
jgi:hypothetical protein